MDSSNHILNSSSFNAQAYKIQQIWQMQNQINECFNKNKDKDTANQSNINEKCIVLVGATNVGKTTLLYYLNGMQLEIRQDKQTMNKQMQAKEIYKKAKIQNALSTTQLPNIYLSQNKYSMIDMPGMNEKKFINIVSNVFTFDLVLNKLPEMKEIHLILVIPQQSIQGMELKQILKEFSIYFNTRKLISSSEKYLSIIFTKTQQDQDSIKQVFIQNLNMLIEQAQQQKAVDEIDLLQFMKYLNQCNENNTMSFYMFPKQEPNQQKGLQIRDNILQKNQNINNFLPLSYQNNQSLNDLLHKNFIQNIFQIRRAQNNTFDENFQSLFRQILKIQEFSVNMLIDISRILHKKLMEKNSDTQQEFIEYIKSFSINCLPFINLFIKNKYEQKTDYLKKGEIQDLLKTIWPLMGQTDALCSFDQKLKQFLCLKNNSQNQSTQISQNRLQNRSLIIQSSSSLGQIYSSLVEILNQIFPEQNRLNMRQSLKNVSKFFEWISSDWYTQLQKINQIEKIKDTLLKLQDGYKQYKAKVTSRFNQQKFRNLKQKIIELSQKASVGDDEQQGSDSQQQPAIKIKQQILCKIQFKDLKAKYIQNNSQKQVLQVIKSTKQQVTSDIQKSRSLQIKPIELFCQNISKKLIERYSQKKQKKNQISNNQVKSGENEENKLEDKIIKRIFGKQQQNNKQKTKLSEQEKKKQQQQNKKQQQWQKNEKNMLFKIINFKHEVFLKNILTNFSYYLKFFIEVSQVHGDNEQHQKLLNKFIENICEMLQQYSLYGQIILFCLLYHNFPNTQKYLRKGMNKNLLSQGFLSQLIKILKLTTSSYVINDQQIQIIQQIIYHVYDHFKSQFCSRLQQINNYQSNCEDDISQIRRQVNSNQRKIQQQQNFQFNPYVLQQKIFNFQQIINKIQIINSRNYEKSRIRSVYKKFQEKFNSKLNPAVPVNKN